MYQPLDVTVQPVRLIKSKLRSLTTISGESASATHNQTAEVQGTVLKPGTTAQAVTETQPRLPTLQINGYSRVKAIAQQSSSGLALQLKDAWHNVDFSQPQWTQIAIAALLMSLPTGVSLVAFRAIATPPQPRCNQPQTFQADLAELQCLHQAMQSNEHPALIRSLKQLKNWSHESPVYGLSQRLLEDWSVVALSLAHEEFEAGRWENAARLAAAIPVSLELGSQAQERLTLWQKVQSQGEKAYDLALEALEQQDWQTARDHAKTLATIGNDYWRQQGIQALPEQIELARQAQQLSDEEAAQLSASAAGLPLPRQGQQQKHSQPAKRSHFAIRPMSLKELTVEDPSLAEPVFSATV